MKKECRLYSEEELQALQAWFAERTLPKDMHIDQATYTEDLPETIAMLMEQAEVCRENPKMQGCFRLLERIKQKLENPE